MYTISGGLYLVLDPAKDEQMILSKTERALQGGVDCLQLWNHWKPGADPLPLVEAVCTLAHRYSVPVLVNEQWEWLMRADLDGVHFDTPPADLMVIRSIVKRPFLTGITCGNDPSRIDWALHNQVDYLSFCSMFPSASAGSCELVRPETVIDVRSKTTAPIFVSGGITPGNIDSLVVTGLNGVAVISGIMEAEDPEAAARAYKQVLYQLKIVSYESSIS